MISMGTRDNNSVLFATGTSIFDKRVIIKDAFPNLSKCLYLLLLNTNGYKLITYETLPHEKMKKTFLNQK